MLLVYLAGPITKGNQFENCHNAILAAKAIRSETVAVIVPQRSALDEIVLGAQDYELWLLEDFELIRRCDALVRLPGESAGADREVEHAKKLNIPVFFGIEAFLDALAALLRSSTINSL